MILPTEVREIINLFEQKGYEAFVVGGAVRDTLMGKVPNDYDICTNCLPLQMKEILKECFIIDFGEKHGTIKIFYKKVPMEITTYRQDGEYIDHRRPNQVEFINCLKEDLNRRDFTINAICFNNEYIDYFGGINDIENKVIRCVGDSYLRFEEDALRILRGLRFSLTFDFEIEENTKKAIFEKAFLLKNISKERIIQELDKMIISPNFFKCFDEYFRIFQEIIPSFKKISISDKQRIVKMLKTAEEKRLVRYAALFFPFASDKSFYSRTDIRNFESDELLKIIKSIFYIKKDIRTMLLLNTNINLYIENSEPFLIKLLRKINYIDLLNLLEYKSLISKIKGLNEDYSQIKDKVIELSKRYKKFDLSVLKINGNDLILLGLKEGREIGLTLEALLEDVINNKVKNTKKELIKYVKELRGL